MPTTRTAQELAQQYRAEYPLQAFAYSKKGDTVGMQGTDGTYHAVASLTLMGTWVAAPHILIDGKRPVRQWIPVA